MKPKPEWIVVANASLARFFSRAQPDAPLVPVATLQHDESRMKVSELVADRTGHEDNDSHRGGATYEPRTDPRRKEHQRFAHEVAQRIDQGLAAGDFAGLTILASASFLGDLKAQLSDAATKALRASHDVDLTSENTRELVAHLAQLAHPTSPSSR